MKRLILLVVLAALALAGTAQAHNGNLWFSTKVGIAKAVEAKYRVTVAGGDCIPTATAHSITSDFGKPRYDHFSCLLNSEKSGRTCWVIAHVTGEKWFQTVLTTTKGAGLYGGCMPKDLGTRAGSRSFS